MRVLFLVPEFFNRIKGKADTPTNPARWLLSAQRRQPSGAFSQTFACTLPCMKVIDHTIPDFKQNARSNSRLIEQIEAGLTEFNQAAYPDPLEAPLTLSAQTDEGTVVAGLLGSNAYGWLRVDIVWVDERHRG